MPQDDKKPDPGHMPSANEPHGSEVHPVGHEMDHPALKSELEPQADQEPETSNDPDDLEDEIDAELNDGDLEQSPKTKKRKR
jgi:hypothetical protein